MMNEQTPTWSCPICSKILQFEHLQVDGFFQSILESCPSSVDDVSVEPDGTWRSSDDKFGTAKPRSTAPSRDASMKPDPALLSANGYVSGNGNGNGHGSSITGGGGSSRHQSPDDPKGKERPSVAIDLSDTDDEDQPLFKRQRTDGFGGNGFGNGGAYGSSVPPRMQHLGGPISVGSSPTPPPALQKRTEMVDLTLDSDEESDAGPARVPPPRRRASPHQDGSTGGGGVAAGGYGSFEPTLDANQLAVKQRLEARNWKQSEPRK